MFPSVDVSVNTLVLLFYYGVAMATALVHGRTGATAQGATDRGTLLSAIVFSMAACYQGLPGYALFAMIPELFRDVLWQSTTTTLALSYFLHIFWQVDLILVAVLGLIMVYHWHQTGDLEPYVAFVVATALLFFVHVAQAQFIVLVLATVYFLQGYTVAGIKGDTLTYLLATCGLFLF